MADTAAPVVQMMDVKPGQPGGGAGADLLAGLPEAVLISTNVDWTQVVTGFNTAKSFAVLDLSGRQLFALAEPQDAAAADAVLTAVERQFGVEDLRYEATAPGGARLGSFRGAYPLLDVEVFGPDGQVVGALEDAVVKRPCWKWLLGGCCDMEYNVYEGADRVAAWKAAESSEGADQAAASLVAAKSRVCGCCPADCGFECCGLCGFGFEINVVDGAGAAVATIKKAFDLKVALNDASTWHLEFAKHCRPEQRLLLLGLVCFLDADTSDAADPSDALDAPLLAGGAAALAYGSMDSD